MFPDWLKPAWFQAPPPKVYQSIFDYSKRVSPYLEGSFGELPKTCISTRTKLSSDQIKTLYLQLAETHPEAGSSYWLTRTWDLLCWQPIYITFISIYGLKSLPDFKHFGQFTKHNYIAGYRFASPDHVHGEIEELIPQAAEQLTALFDHYREQINQWTRIRPGFTNHLLADLILRCLILLQEHEPTLDNEYITEQARLWLHGFNLPVKHLASLQLHPKGEKLILARMSCCLVYKCQSGTLCADCPRQKQNKSREKA
ncbi:siderophore ferric iron reductase [Vibrio sp. TBV020]|uniref:siderophore ferric iron reductase n=1 Tax=Vibrio sp. TBV020 TaxID=3137398 RepID=UPI0038CD6175